MLIPLPTYRHAGTVELRGESLLLEAQLRPTTVELNSYPLRVNRQTWLRNLEKAEECAAFHTDYCRYLAKDDAFRPNSPADCRRALKTEQTDADSLVELAHQGCLLASAVLDARSTISRRSQLRAWGTFAGLGSVQPSWDSCGTPHGRYTSDSPCLNNRIDSVRETVEPPPGFTFLSLDLTAAEYLTWASLSRDPVLLKAFETGTDFHTTMAEGVKSLVPSWCPDDLRSAGKTLNYAVLYQMTPFALARKLGCSQDLANQIIDSYYGRVPTAANYVLDTLARAEFFGFVETYFGRRRYCPEYQRPIGARETHELEKSLWNHRVAGTAAEITKTKQLRTWEALRRANFTPDHIRLSVQTYDGIVMSVRDDCLSEARELAEEKWNQTEPGFLSFRSKTRIGKTLQEVNTK